MDQLDNSIIQILRKNGRASFQEMAKLLNAPESTIRSRVKGLESKGAIRGYSAVVDPSKLGFGSVAMVGIDTAPERFLELANMLTEFESVKSVSTCSGDHMIMTEIWMENASQLRDFIRNKVEKIDGVTRTCPAIVMERLKEA